MEKTEVLAIIIARGGSKSIPRKNLIKVKGKPLIAWPITLAKSVSDITRVVVSTDDAEIMTVAKKYGAEIPFVRPKELSDDETTTLPVLRHCLKYLFESEGYKPDIVVLLYPTSPFLKKQRVAEALALFSKHNCNSVVSVVRDWGRFWIENPKTKKHRVLYPLKRVNRQYYKPLLKENGAIYFSKYDVLVKNNKLVDEKSVEFVVMDEDENIDIDLISDLKKAQAKTLKK